jgi:hypothetical protein
LPNLALQIKHCFVLAQVKEDIHIALDHGGIHAANRDSDVR